jgi:hypothetical protein
MLTTYMTANYQCFIVTTLLHSCTRSPLPQTSATDFDLCLLKVNIGDYVKLCPSDPRVPLYICKVISMWEDSKGEKMFHGRWMRYAIKTVYGQVRKYLSNLVVENT